MSLYPSNIEEKIGFSQIRELLTASCSTPSGRAAAEELQIMNDLQSIRLSMTMASELRKLLQQGKSPVEAEFEPVDEAIHYAGIEGSMLTMEQLYNIMLVLGAANESLSFLNQNQEDCPVLFEQYKNLEIDKGLLKQLERCIDERGELRDSASKELQRIRKKAAAYEQQARNKLTQFFNNAKKAGFTPEGSSISVRSGRLVLPVLSEYKKRVKGLVHDMSSTGSTLFIEPENVLELNNELREYQHLERREINRILSELTSMVRAAGNMREVTRFLGELDFIRSKARLSVRLNCSMPVLSTGRKCEWRNARHPLLYLSFLNQKKNVVPQHFILDEENRIILISGPNAGGKSVCLKTLGLMQYMAQCGMEIPVDEDSEIRIFQNLFIDIGDEQSLENDLSTYSSHLLNMKYFMEKADADSLILIDEFGTGTDPEYGGSIAEAVLFTLINKKSMGMITTHYGNLKQFAENNSGVINGAMQFDASRMEPLYRLEIGKPGSSFAIEIASRIGLDKETLDRAKKIIGEEKVKLDELISSLEKEKIDLQNKLKVSVQLNQQLENNIQKYRELRDMLDDQKKDIIEKAKEEAQSMLKQTNAQIERTIREIRESSAEKKKTREIREELKKFEKEVTSRRVRPKRKERKSRDTMTVLPGEIRINDQVRIKGQETKGTVLSIKGKEAELMIGALRSNVKLSRLEKIGSAPKKEGFIKSRSGGLDISRKMAEFKTDIDIRGRRVEEVLPELEKYMDNALMFNASQLRIVHGKGNGVLREVVRNYLKGYQEIKSISDEHADRGGSGVTIVQL